MPWNEPGSGKSPNSNGGKRPNNAHKRGASEIEDIIENLRKGFGGKSGNGGSGLSMLPIILIAAVAFFAFKSVYTVQEGNQSVELRLGKHNETVGPGLNFMLWPIDRRIVVDTQKLRTVEVGYRGRGSSQSPRPDEALMLTNDENIVDVTMAVQYTIKDVEQLIFNVGDVVKRQGLDLVVRGATESALREVVGSTTMDELLTQGRGVVDSETKSLLQDILDRYLTGIDINSIEIQDAVPPSAVSAAFDDVVKADQDKVTLVNQAEAYANDIIPKARGRASRTLQQAEAYKQSTIAKSEGEAQRFTQILKEYLQAPEVTRKRMYIETMETVLGNTNKVMIDQQGGNSLMYLPIDKLVGEQRANVNSTISKQVQTNSVQAPRNTRERDQLLRSAIREGR